MRGRGGFLFPLTCFPPWKCSASLSCLPSKKHASCWTDRITHAHTQHRTPSGPVSAWTPIRRQESCGEQGVPLGVGDTEDGGLRRDAGRKKACEGRPQSGRQGRQGAQRPSQRAPGRSPAHRLWSVRYKPRGIVPLFADIPRTPTVCQALGWRPEYRSQTAAAPPGSVAVAGRHAPACLQHGLQQPARPHWPPTRPAAPRPRGAPLSPRCQLLHL